MSIYSTQYSSRSEETCLLCENGIRTKDFPEIICRALERKYCSNLNNFFFSKIIDKMLAKKRCRDYVTYVETVNFLEDEYFKRFYKLHETPKKLSKLFPYYKSASFRPYIFQRSVMRTHILFYYAQEQIQRGEPVFDFSSTQNSSSSVSDQPSADLQCLLKSINKFDPRYHFKSESSLSAKLCDRTSKLFQKNKIPSPNCRGKIPKTETSNLPKCELQAVLKKSGIFKRKLLDGGSNFGRSELNSYLLIKTTSDIGFEVSLMNRSKRAGLSRVFDVDVSDIEKNSFLNALAKEKRRSCRQQNGIREKIKLESLDAYPSEVSISLLTTPNSKKDLLFRKDNFGKEKARLLDITEKKISSKKIIMKNNLNNQNCTKKILNPAQPPRKPEEKELTLDRFKEQYYMNLSALKPRRGNDTVGESSDKSLAAIVNLLGEKFKEPVKNNNFLSRIIKNRMSSNLNEKILVQNKKNEKSERGKNHSNLRNQEVPKKNFNNLEINLSRDLKIAEGQFTYRKTEETNPEASKIENFSNLKTQKSQTRNKVKIPNTPNKSPPLEKIIETREATQSLKVSATNSKIKSQSKSKQDQPAKIHSRLKPQEIEEHVVKFDRPNPQKFEGGEKEFFKTEHLPTPAPDQGKFPPEEDFFLADCSQFFENEALSQNENCSKPDLLKVVTLSSKKVDFLQTLESRISLLKKDEIPRPKLLAQIPLAKILNFQKKTNRKQKVLKPKNEIASQNKSIPKNNKKKSAKNQNQLTSNRKNWEIAKLKITKLDSKNLFNLNNLNLENLEQNFLKHKRAKQEAKTGASKNQRKRRNSKKPKLSLRKKILEPRQKEIRKKKSQKILNKKSGEEKSKSRDIKIKFQKSRPQSRNLTPNRKEKPKSQLRKKTTPNLPKSGRRGGQKNLKSKRRKTLTIKTKRQETPSRTISISPINSVSRIKSRKSKAKQKRLVLGKTRERGQINKKGKGKKSKRVSAAVIEKQFKILRERSQPKNSGEIVKSAKRRILRNDEGLVENFGDQNDRFTRSKMLRKNLRKDIQKLNILSNRLSKMKSAEKSTTSNHLTCEIPFSQRAINHPPQVPQNPSHRLNLRRSLKVHKNLNIPLSKKPKAKPIWNRRIDMMRKELMSLSQENRQSVRVSHSQKHLLTFQNHRLEQNLDLQNISHRFKSNLDGVSKHTDRIQKNENPKQDQHQRQITSRTKRHKSHRNSHKKPLAAKKSAKSNKKFKVDLRKLEENLRLRELKSRSQEKHISSKQKFQSSATNRLLQKTFQHNLENEGKVKIANYLKTERPVPTRQSTTPKIQKKHRSSKIIDLQKIAVQKKSRPKAKNSKNRVEDFRSCSKARSRKSKSSKKAKKRRPKSKKGYQEKMTGNQTTRTSSRRQQRAETEAQNIPNQKKSVNSLNLSKRPKKLSKEETLLVLKSLESDRKAKRLLSEMDLFFLKDSKIKKRYQKKHKNRFSSKASEKKNNNNNKNNNYNKKNFPQTQASHPVTQINQFWKEEKWARSKRRQKALKGDRMLNFTEASDPFDSHTHQFNSIVNQKKNLMNHFKMKFKTRPVNELLPVKDKSAGFCSDKKGY